MQRLAVCRVFPLSLLSFAASCKAFSCASITHLENHDPIVTPEVGGMCNNPIVKSKVDNGHIVTPGLSHMFRRHVKPKKQYEIKHLGEVRQSATYMFHVSTIKL